MQFFAVRYLLVEEQKQLFSIEEEGRKITDVFLDTFRSGKQIIHYARAYLFYQLGTDVGKNFELGYMLKSVETPLIELTGQEITESELPNWERLLYVLDRTHQIIIFEHKSGIATHENIRNILLELCGPAVQAYGYKLEIEFIGDEKEFWRIIENAEELYEVGFDLKAPNLFDGWLEANDIMKMLKEAFNNTSAMFKAVNDAGGLIVKKENVDSYRALADSGGGNWFIRARLRGRARAIRYKSRSNIRTERIDDLGTTPSYIRENVQEVLRRLDRIINRFRELL